MATTKDLDNAVKYLKKLKVWLPKQQKFNRDTATTVNRLKRKIYGNNGKGGPAPIAPPPPPPFKP